MLKQLNISLSLRAVERPFSVGVSLKSHIVTPNPLLPADVSKIVCAENIFSGACIRYMSMCPILFAVFVYIHAKITRLYAWEKFK